MKSNVCFRPKADIRQGRLGAALRPFQSFKASAKSLENRDSFSEALVSAFDTFPVLNDTETHSFPCQLNKEVVRCGVACREVVVHMLVSGGGWVELEIRD